MTETIVQFKTIQTSSINTVMNTLKESLIDVVFNFRKDRFYVRQFDQSKTLLIDLNFNSHDEYTCTEDVNIGVNIAKFTKSLSVVNNYDLFVLEVVKERDSNDPKLVIKMFNKSQNKRLVTNVQSLDTDEPPINDDALELKCDHVVNIPSKSFKGDCNFLKNNSEVIELIINNNKLIMKSIDKDTEQEISTIEYNTNDGSDNSIDIETKNSASIVQGYYNITKICELMKCASINNNISLQIGYKGNGIPVLNIECKIADLGYIRYYLGPKTNI
jgi:proliferating cell nuclear antigen PCNA